MLKYSFWIDNGEEKNDEDLKTPELRLEDDSNLSINAICCWAAEELDEGDASSMTIICLEHVSGRWFEVDLYRGGWHVSTSRETSPEELKGEY